MTGPKKRWRGTEPHVCQVCHRPLRGDFVDGKTQLGFWCVMCRSCHTRIGLGLGLGLGQRYNLLTKEKLEG